MLYSKIEGSGIPFVIIHGFLGMSDNWKTLGAQFAQNGYQVHMLDLRNHGRSFHSDEFNYDVMTQDVLEYCNYHNLKNIILLGHSMGGKVAMNVATLYPELVDKLMIADIGPKYYKPHHQEILSGLAAVDFASQPDRNQVESILQGYIPDFGTRQFLMKSLFWKEPGQLAFRFNLDVFVKEIDQVGMQLDSDRVFSKPTLFIRGGASNYVLDSDFNTIEKHFPNVDIKTIPNVGHWLHAENPSEFYNIVSSFLNN
jgi:esterase